MPRCKSSIWLKFHCLPSQNSGKWAKCKTCKKEMQGIPSRMEKHILTCNKDSATPLLPTDATKAESQPSTSNAGQQNTFESLQVFDPDNEFKLPADAAESKPSTSKTQSSLKRVHDSDIINTTKEYCNKINMQIGRYFYATNTPFNHVEHAEFKQMCALLRPGHKCPSAYEIGNPILEKMHTKIMAECRNKIMGESVCMSLDGWSNVHNEPIICCSILTSNGESFLVDSVETGADSHNASNLKDIALNAIKRAGENFEVKVKSFVTDNAANVQKMRSNLSDDPEVDIIEYGCSAHFLNLLAQDLEIPVATAHILKVIKYFRNKHVPNALYKAAKGKKLIMPLEVRWNTMSDAVKTYLENRGILVQLCQDNETVIEKNILNIVNDVQITNNAVDLLSRLQPISIALDRMQSNSTTIAVAVEIWNMLESELRDQPLHVKKHFYKRRKMALQGVHFAANMFDHRFLGKNLNNIQKQEGYKFISEVNVEFLPHIMALSSSAEPFPKYMFGPHFRKVSPLVWWKSMSTSIKNDSDWPLEKNKFLELCTQLLTASAATASLERQFSSFGLIQSKLRNRLGNQKAAKLVFLFKYFNQCPEKRNTDLEWIWNNNGRPETEETVLSGSSDDDLPLI